MYLLTLIVLAVVLLVGLPLVGSLTREVMREEADEIAAARRRHPSARR